MALNLLFPQRCVGCGQEGSILCSSCRSLLMRIVPPLCPRCGKSQPDGLLCSGCADWHSEIDGIRSPFQFDGVIRQSIHNLKYGNLRILAIPLARLLYDYLYSNPLPGEILVPVPLHEKRLKERGYNQSGLIAAELSKLSNLPVVNDCLIRQRHTLPQVKTVSVEERRNNVIGVFVCRDKSFKDRQIILIDDVSTSGATLNACAAALKESGAMSVWGLVLAREI